MRDTNGKIGNVFAAIADCQVAENQEPERGLIGVFWPVELIVYSFVQKRFLDKSDVLAGDLRQKLDLGANCGTQPVHRLETEVSGWLGWLATMTELQDVVASRKFVDYTEVRAGDASGPAVFVPGALNFVLVAAYRAERLS